MIRDVYDYKLPALDGKHISIGIVCTIQLVLAGSGPFDKSISVTISIDQEGVLKFPCYIGSALASTFYQTKISGIFKTFKQILKNYSNSVSLL